MKWMPTNWKDLLMPEMPILETALRAGVLYFFILFILRILPRRTAGELGAMDLVFILLITESASHALGDFSTLGDGLIMLSFFIGFNYLVNQLTYRSTFFQKVFDHQPVPIIKDGKLLRRNMRKELLTEDELMASLRQNGMDDISEVRKACVESDGHISFINYDDNPNKSTKKERIK